MIININRPICKLDAPHSILLCSMWRPFPILTFFSHDLFNTEQLPLLYLEGSFWKTPSLIFPISKLVISKFFLQAFNSLSALHVSTSSCLQITNIIYICIYIYYFWQSNTIYYFSRVISFSTETLCTYPENGNFSNVSGLKAGCFILDNQ